MNRSKAIILTAFINSGLLIVLFFTAITPQEERVSSSASLEVAGAILEKNPEGMLPIETPKESLPQVKEPAFSLAYEPMEEKKEIVHKLPEVATALKEPIVNQASLAEVKVKKGDSLEKIAKRCQISVGELKSMNQLESNLLQIGQALIVPKKEVKEEMYTVRCGDNPWTISMKHHMKVDDLLRLNQLNNEKAKKIRPGDKLRVR